VFGGFLHAFEDGRELIKTILSKIGLNGWRLEFNRIV